MLRVLLTVVLVFALFSMSVLLTVLSNSKVSIAPGAADAATLPQTSRVPAKNKNNNSTEIMAEHNLPLHSQELLPDNQIFIASRRIDRYDQQPHPQPRQPQTSTINNNGSSGQKPPSESEVPQNRPLDNNPDAKTRSVQHNNRDSGQDTADVGATTATDAAVAAAGKEYFLQILRDSRVDFDKDEALTKLPTWNQVEALYGTGGPKMVGLERCAEFRESVPSTARVLGGAGLWNTGTNALWAILGNNCNIVGPNRTVEFQVPWGKHMPAAVRETGHSAPLQTWIRPENVLPIVIVKDPLTWMQSMCQNPYRVRWFHKNADHCPNLAPATEKDWNKAVPYTSVSSHSNITHTMEVTVQYPSPLKDAPLTWPSLAHLWSNWNRDYYQLPHYPRLMIRYEDLLFRAPETVRQICDCVGGQLRHAGKHKYLADSAKSKQSGHGASSNLLSALIKYGNAENRKKGMTADDLTVAKEALDPELMEIFHYSL